ncbi:MAG: hypothetical protein AB1816_06050 [Bacillota bacterium]
MFHFSVQGPTVPLPSPPQAPAGLDTGKMLEAVQAWGERAVAFLQGMSSPVALVCVLVGGALFLFGLGSALRGLARVGLGVALGGVGVWLFLKYAPLVFAMLGGR